MKRIKLLAAIQAFAMAVSMLAFNAGAENNNLLNVDDIDNLITISREDIPDGITPIEFENEEEFLEFYNDYLSKDIVFENCSGDVMHYPSARSYGGSYSGSYTSKKDLIKIGASITSIRLQTNFTYEKENTVGPLPVNKPRYRFKTTKASCIIAGFTLGVGISQVSTSTSLSNYKSVCTSQGNGTIDYYIIYQGIGKLYSKPFSISHTFNIINAI